MRILRTIVLGVAGFATVMSLTGLALSGQTKGGAGMMDHKMSMAGKTMTSEEKIADAVAAAPTSVTADCLDSS